MPKWLGEPKPKQWAEGDKYWEDPYEMGLDLDFSHWESLTPYMRQTLKLAVEGHLMHTLLGWEAK